jgi:Fimbrial assembly protein (PilN).
LKICFRKDDHTVDLFGRFRLPLKKALSIWLLVSVVGVVVAIASLSISFWWSYQSLSLLQQEQEVSEKRLGALQLQMKKLAEVCPQKAPDFDRQKDLVACLSSIALIIPEKTWLNKFVIEVNTVMLEGCSNSYHEMMEFYAQLSKMKQMLWSGLEHHVDASQGVQFVIKGALRGVVRCRPERPVFAK